MLTSLTHQELELGGTRYFNRSLRLQVDTDGRVTAPTLTVAAGGADIAGGATVSGATTVTGAASFQTTPLSLTVTGVATLASTVNVGA